MYQYFNRNQTNKLNKSLLSTLHKGFNSFHEIEIPSQKKQKIIFRSKKLHTMTQFYSTQKKSKKKISRLNFDQTCPNLSDTLTQNKTRLQRVKTQVDALRTFQYNEYLKKSLRYQQLLNLNQNKKKHLPTMNTKVGQVVKKSAIQSSPKNYYYEIKFDRLPMDGWKPQSRQGHTCIIYNNHAIIIGGHCSHAFSNAHVYSFQHNNWIKQINTQSARSYHTSLVYKNRFIVSFGGMGQYDVSRKTRICFNTVNLIDLSNFTIRSMKMHNQDNIQPRRSHCAVLMSKNMIVFGGMNSRKQYLSDLVYLDLKQLRWYHKQYQQQGKQLTQNIQTGLAKHKGIAYFKDRKQTPLYSAQYTQSQGIYLIGGTFGNLQQNIILLLSFNKYIPTLKKVDYSGIPPSSIDPIVQRINQMIIIVSGQQKQREIRLFKPSTKDFIMINNSYSKYLGGIGSTINKYHDSYYLFFGLGEEGYLGSINNFEIQEKVMEVQAKKKKIKYKNQQINQWKNQKWEIDSTDSFNI